MIAFELSLNFEQEVLTRITKDLVASCEFAGALEINKCLSAFPLGMLE